MTKPLGRSEYREVIYDADRWDLLKKLRNKTILTMKALSKVHLESVVHGSVVRGDVKPGSDIDIFVPLRTSSFSIETALEKAGMSVNRRLLVQATPRYMMKALVEIDEETVVSFPLMHTRRVDREFYKFGGEISLESIMNDLRVPGVDKRLMLIMPTERGHMESSIIGQEQLAARILKISADTVLNRVHTLLRRDQVGRTGIFVKIELPEGETFEMTLQRLTNQNPAVRRRMTDSS